MLLGDHLAGFLFPRRAAHTRDVWRIRSRDVRCVSLPEDATGQLVGGLWASAVTLLREGRSETFWFYLEVSAAALREAEEDIAAFAGSMAALFVDMSRDVALGFPAEPRDAVVTGVEASCADCVGAMMGIGGGERCMQ